MTATLSPDQRRFVERLQRVILDEVERSASMVPAKDLPGLVEKAVDAALDQLRQNPPTGAE